MSVSGARFVRVCVVAFMSAALHAAAEDLPLDRLLSTEISTASKYAQTMAHAAASVTIISSEEIRRYGWQTLADVMQTVRGFYGSYDRNYHYIGVRGFSRPTDYNNRLLLLLNGQALNENLFGSAPFGTDLAIDLDIIERIEIVRGPGSAVYGTGAMFAVVNLVTKKGSAIDGGNLKITAGSAGRLAGYLEGGTETSTGVDVAVSAVLNRTEGRDLTFGEFPGLVARGLDYDDYQGVLATIRTGRFSILANSATRRKGMPTASYGVDFGHPASSTTDERALGEIRYEQPLGTRAHLVLRGFAQQYHYDGTYPYDGERWFDRGDGHWLGAEARYRTDLRANHRITTGVEYTRHLHSGYQFAPGGGGAGEGFGLPYRVVSAYAEDEYQPRANVSIIAGLRYDEYSHISHHALSPRAAVVWEPRGGTAVKLLAGRAYRAPSTYELSYIDPFGGVQGNQRLEVESIDTIEAVFEHRLSDSVWGAVNLYQYRVEDLIDPRELNGVLRYENVGTVEARGIEAELHSRFRAIWTYANVALQDATEAGQHITNSPRVIARAGASASLGARSNAALEVLYESSRHTVYHGRVDGVLLANARVAFALTPRIELAAVIRNLTDTAYASPAGFEHRQEAIEQDGRTFIVTLRLER